MKKIKYPVNIGKSNFPMKANLNINEINYIKKWDNENIYKKIQNKRIKFKKFILHDGPPYANGSIHIGHSVNKILKDIIIKHNILLGYNIQYIPGWDCHGMPIEIEMEKKYNKLNINEFYLKTRKYVNEQIEIQKNQFKRLGIIADWNNAYKTMDYKNQAEELKIFSKILRKNYLYIGYKPVYWCFNCKSSLPEIEIEYNEKKTLSISVGFIINNFSKIINIFKIKYLTFYKNGFIIIWTTAPWTIIANQGININPECNYALVECLIKKNFYLTILSINVVKFFFIRNKLPYKILSIIKGDKILFLKFLHPLNKVHKFFNKLVTIYPNNNTNSKNGTGVVHIAPSHGLEDYESFKKYNKKKKILDLFTIDGYVKKNIPIFKNIHIWKLIDIICNILSKFNLLIDKHYIKHKYIFCNRHKIPIIYKITSQWFVSMDRITKNNNLSLRNKAINIINNIKFYPEDSKYILKNLIKNRPDWTLSRQRNWGVPIAVFFNKKTKKLHPKTFKLLKIIYKKIKKNGIEEWNNINLKNIKSCSKNYKNYIKSKDILDVWFDSGVTHTTILKKISKNKLLFPANLYLEGIDQHRGWFNTSLLTSIMLYDISPFKSLLTHNFIVNKHGKKLSKSNQKNNNISLDNILKKYGADILRLWVASNNYYKEFHISFESFDRNVESYRRIRNTIKFLLSNINDFNIKKNYVNYDKMVMIDKYMLYYLIKLKNKIINFYNNYNFNSIIFLILKFCSEDLGSFYLDILKDRLYIMRINNTCRRSGQTILWYILKTLLLLLSPILSFTTEEAWNYFKNKSFNLNQKFNTIFNEKYNVLPKINNIKEIFFKFILIKKIKDIIIKKLEKLRNKNKIGSSLECHVILYLKKKKINVLSKFLHEIKFVMIISKFNIFLNNKKEYINIKILNNKINYKKCQRCWNFTKNNKNNFNICNRCINNLYYIGETRYYI